MRRVLITALVIIPGIALALDFTDATARYKDAPFPIAETAGISLLTSAGALQGNPDGTFAPRRTLNRAEFLKIALLSRSGGTPVQAEEDVSDCFPDIHTGDWFSQFVCHAKAGGIVAGYPDGLFHPERPVNYAEAIKMLVNVFSYGLPAPVSGDAWYVPFVSAATSHKVLLPVSLGLGDPLTRGQMARLAAAFLAESTGELTVYRNAERGIFESTGSSSTSSSSSSSSSSLSSSISSSSSQQSAPLFPARSNLLLIGRTTPILFDGVFESTGEPAVLRSAQITLEREITSIESISLIDGSGAVVGEMALDISNNNDHTRWVGNFGTGNYILPKDKTIILGLRAVLRDRAHQGGSKEMFEIADAGAFFLFAEGTDSHTLRQLFPASPHYPFSETVQARIESVTGTLPSQGTLTVGTNREIASFWFGGTILTGATLQLQALNFHLASHGVTVTGWRIGGPAEVQQQPCGLDNFTNTIDCPIIPEDFKTVGNTDRVISLYADVSVPPGSTDSTLQVSFTQNGTIGMNGDVWWSDGAGSYRWLEESVVLPMGPRWSVK
ncbi:S-layer homology domain-containing protein [Candidatus Uhrbacteria bacterium]|nr:S-layer homology domain-containing protein [Candidatus Uhrbacteria bacterium]